MHIEDFYISEDNFLQITVKSLAPRKSISQKDGMSDGSKNLKSTSGYWQGSTKIKGK